jgi:hypothetical protein
MLNAGYRMLSTVVVLTRVKPSCAPARKMGEIKQGRDNDFVILL